MDYLSKQEKEFAFDALGYYNKMGLKTSLLTGYHANEILKKKSYGITASRAQKIIEDLVSLGILRKDEYGIVINPVGEEMLQKKGSLINKAQSLYFISKRTFLEAKFIVGSFTFLAGFFSNTLLEFFNKFIASFG